MDAKSLGPIIREWRIEAGFTQQELGRIAGIPKRIVGSIERGQRTPERWEIVNLCRALGRAPAELITLWYRSCLNEFSELGKLPDARMAPPEEKGSRTLPDSESRVDQIIDQIAALAKEIYHESRNDFKEVFLDWLAQSGLSSSFPPPSPPRRARRRASRKRGSPKA
jgi:transcriptional regulator with XRE-family HTH domain